MACNARATLATLVRAPRPAGRRLAWPPRSWLAFLATLAIVTVAAAAIVLDAWSITRARGLPLWLIGTFDRITDLGLSGWFLWPTALAMIALAILHARAVPRYVRNVLAAVGVRIGFVFLAVAVPGLFVAIVKRLIGRARPLVESDAVWAYRPLGWQVEYASLPSGHATTAFSVLIALGALWPRARALLWAYAVLVAISRVVVTAHFPSDVIAGAIVGSVGALLVRNWFAHRRLGFVVGSDGGVRLLPGPRWRHIKAVARRLRSA
jgi:undecaprenyl-diphosphatase